MRQVGDVILMASLENIFRIFFTGAALIAPAFYGIFR